jgi:hypothetical protein
MSLPRDYVNYTKVSFVDSSGIKHPLYPTSSTSNPFSILQHDNGEYDFSDGTEYVIDGDFASGAAFGAYWSKTLPSSGAVTESVGITDGALTITHDTPKVSTTSGTSWGAFAYGKAYAVWQQLDVTGMDYITLKATATVAAAATYSDSSVRVGITTTDPTVGWPAVPLTGPNVGQTVLVNASRTVPVHTTYSSPNQFVTSRHVTPITREMVFDLGILEWTSADEGGVETTKQSDEIELFGINTVWVLIHSHTRYDNTTTARDAGTYSQLASPPPAGQITATNSVDNISVEGPGVNLQRIAGGNSTTWNNYKSGTPSENQDDYQDDTYWPANGERYGLDPQHAQANGSFYMDNTSGKIHFSSNISGKTVVLDYISDSLGTDGEMQVHKFAEEAMYKWIAHAILATRANTQEYLVNRFKKERFAAVRTAKLRLSNIKLEEITQILRGKSKQIKH